jgi:hypothetical protein
MLLSWMKRAHAEAVMAGLQRYRVRHYVANSVWIPPFLCMVAALFAVRLLHEVEGVLGWEADGAEAHRRAADEDLVSDSRASAGAG